VFLEKLWKNRNNREKANRKNRGCKRRLKKRKKKIITKTRSQREGNIIFTLEE
jgi:hypothetical protein